MFDLGNDMGAYRRSGAACEGMQLRRDSEPCKRGLMECKLCWVARFQQFPGILRDAVRQVLRAAKRLLIKRAKFRF